MKRTIIYNTSGHNSNSCPETSMIRTTAGNRIIGELKRVGVLPTSKKDNPTELKRVSRRKSSKSSKPYEVDPQNACVTNGKSEKLVVAMPQDKCGNAKEAKKRRAFEDLGNKNKPLETKRLKKSWLTQSTKQEKEKPSSLPVPTLVGEKENHGVKVKTYKIGKSKDGTAAEKKLDKKDYGDLRIKVKDKHSSKHSEASALISDTKINRRKHRLLKHSALSLLPDIPIPHALDHNIGEANWDLSNLSRAIDNLICEPPEGVVDIDEVCKDYFYCPDFARDIVMYLKDKEQRYKIDQAFLDDDPEVNPNMRSILIDWLVQVQNHLNLTQKTLHTTVALIDLYLQRKRVPLSKLQLIGITNMLIASKFEERFAPSVDKLVHLTDNTYTYDNVIQMELVALKDLKFFVNPPVAMDFLDRYLMCLPIYDELEYLSRYILDLALHDYHCLEFVGSLRAATSIYVSCKTLPSLVEDMKEPWTEELQFYTGYKEEDLLSCAERFARLLLKAPASKYQGARQKYGQSNFKAISQFSCLCDTNVQNIAKGNHSLEAKDGSKDPSTMMTIL